MVQRHAASMGVAVGAQQVLLHMERWGLKWLWHILCIRRAPEEGRQAYHSRSLGHQTSHKFMRQRLLTEAFRSAWRVRHVPAPDGHNYLSEERSARQTLVGRSPT